MFELKGVYTPVAIPFTDGEIDYDKAASNLEFLCSSKLEGVVLLGSNAEFVALSDQEKREYIKFACDFCKGRKHVIVGTGGNNIKDTHDLNKFAAECGADAVLVVTPFYYKGAMKDPVLENYFTEVADKSPLPVVLYNMPGNTGVNTSSSLLVKLSKHPNIIGVKDTSGNIVQIAETIKDADPSFHVFAGNWGFLFPSLMLGAKGATLALANVCPNECVELMELIEAGKCEEARQHAFKFMALNSAVTAQFGIGGLKYAMEQVGLYGGEPRLPLRRPNEENQAKIRAILAEAGLI